MWSGNEDKTTATNRTEITSSQIADAIKKLSMFPIGLCDGCQCKSRTYRPLRMPNIPQIVLRIIYTCMTNGNKNANAIPKPT